MALPMIAEQSIAQKGSTPLEFIPSQPQVLVGPTFGVNRNYHSGGFRTIPDPGCPLFEDGTGWGFAIGFSAEFLPVVDGRWGIISRFTFEQRPGQFRQDLPNAKVLRQSQTDPNNSVIVDQSVSTTSDITYSLLNAEVMYKQEILHLSDIRIGVLAGPAFQYVIGGTNRQVQDLEAPDNARFTNPEGYPTARSGRQLIFFDGNIPDRNGARISVKAGLQGEIGLFDNQWSMTPGIYYDYGLTDVTTAESWQLHSMFFQVDLRRAF